MGTLAFGQQLLKVIQYNNFNLPQGNLDPLIVILIPSIMKLQARHNVNIKLKSAINLVRSLTYCYSTHFQHQCATNTGTCLASLGGVKLHFQMHGVSTWLDMAWTLPQVGQHKTKVWLIKFLQPVYPWQTSCTVAIFPSQHSQHNSSLPYTAFTMAQ